MTTIPAHIAALWQAVEAEPGNRVIRDCLADEYREAVLDSLLRDV